MKKSNKDFNFLQELDYTHKILQKSHPILSSQYFQSTEDWKTQLNIILLQDYIKLESKKNFNCLEIKIENLFIEVRELVYSFIKRNINIIDAVLFQNIGIISQEIPKNRQSSQLKFRQSMPPSYGYNSRPNLYPFSSKMLSHQKFIAMPEFRIFICKRLCKTITGQDNIGKLIIEAEIFLNQTFRKNLYQILYEQTTERRQILSSLQHSDANSKIQKTQDPNLLCFTGKRRRNKRNKVEKEIKKQEQSSQLFQKNPTILHASMISKSKTEFSTNESIKSFKKITQNPKFQLNNCSDTALLTAKIKQIVNRSKRGLKTFRSKFIEPIYQQSKSRQ